MNRLDQLTELNLRLICKSNSKSMYDVRFLDVDGKTELWSLGNNQHKQLADYLEQNGLITRNGENCHLTIKSEKICEKGWIEYLKTENGDNFVLEMKEETISVLKKLMDGQSYTITKDRPEEIRELIPKLNNLGIINKVERFKYAADFGKRKHLSKLIEIGSWDEFLNWLDGQNTDSVITNNFPNSTIGTIIQDSDLTSSKFETTANMVSEKQLAKKSLAIRFWELISNNKLIVLLIGVGIEEAAWGNIWKWITEIISGL
ncbi:hypothetical protein [Maribacter sedimenticola]|nr:hypothetical protein [Maribacter sedimenticola]